MSNPKERDGESTVLKAVLDSQKPKSACGTPRYRRSRHPHTERNRSLQHAMCWAYYTYVVTR
jgi:hypothetical protein